MNILLTAGSWAQFLTVLVVFVAVLGVTAWVTRWMANYQKQQTCDNNIQILETTRITNNKYLQLIRVGGIYMVIAVCKDTVTMLGEVPEEQLHFRKDITGGTSFRELLDRTMKSGSGTNSKIDSSDRSETGDDQ